MNIVKVFSTEVDSKLRRLIKFLRLGKSDVQTAYQAGSYGMDSNPIKNMVAIYAETGKIGDTVIIGYINRDQLAEPGEIRIFSTDDDGGLKSYVWCKKDGKVLLSGDVDNAVRYIALNTGIQQQASDINVELNKIAVAINAIVPGSYSPIPIMPDISGSKIDELRTP